GQFDASILLESRDNAESGISCWLEFWSRNATGPVPMTEYAIVALLLSPRIREGPALAMQRRARSHDVSASKGWYVGQDLLAALSSRVYSSSIFVPRDFDPRPEF